MRINILLIILSFCTGVVLAQESGKNESGLVSDSVKQVLEHSKLLNVEVPLVYDGLQPRTETTSSISIIKGEDLRSMHTPALGNYLYGRLAGLYVGQNGGEPGNNDDPDLMIRGLKTIGDNSLLVLVDGFETKWSSINIEDVESFTVLKDASALAIFGQKGANGVLLITTKRGETNQAPQIVLNTKWGIQSPENIPNFLGQGDYAAMFNKALINDGKEISSGYFYNPDINVEQAFQNQQYPYLYPNVNWYDEVLKSHTISQDYNISIRGGDNTARYYVSLGYGNYEGLLNGTDSRRMTNSNYSLTRYNLRSNVDVKFNELLSAEIGLRATVDAKYLPNTDLKSLWKTMGVFLPYPVQTPEGKWGGTEGYDDNPVASILQKGYNRVNERTVDTRVKLILNLNSLTKGLSAHGQIALSNNYYSTYKKNRGYAYDELSPRPDLIIPGETLEGEMPYDKITKGVTDANFEVKQASGSQWNRTTFLSGLDYERDFDNVHLTAALSYYQNKYEAKGSDMPYAQQSVIGRMGISLNNKYLLDFSSSYSGTENFSRTNRFGFFPALSAGWILSNEDFLTGISGINFLKIRGSAGLTGSDRTGNIGRFIYNQYYVGNGSYLLGTNFGFNASMYEQGQLANTDVTWEKAMKYNIGFDAMFLNSVSIVFDYFFEKRKDMFISPENYLPATIGASYHNVNKGIAQSQGLELELLYNKKIGSFNFSAGGNVAYTKSQVVDIAEPVRADQYLYSKGNSISQPFVLEANGYFKDQNDIDTSPVQMFGAVSPGDVKYIDQNNDGFIDDNDRKPIGYSATPELIYGFSTGLEWKGIDLNIFFQGAANRTVSLMANGNIMPFINGGVKPVQWVKDNYWTPERGDASLFPRLTTEQNANNERPSTLWQRNGSFLRLKNVELGYTLPKHVMDQVNIDKLRIFFSGVNLWSHNQIDEINTDPEIMNQFIHPAMKSYNLGLTVNF